MAKQLSKFSKLNLSKVKQLRKFKIKYDNIRNLELLDKNKDYKQESFNQYRLKIDPNIFKILTIWGRSRPTFNSDEAYLQNYSSLHYPKGKVAIIVNSGIYDAVRASINQYVVNLARDGYFGLIYTVNGASPSGLKNHLKSIIGLKGAVMVGNVPVAWFEMSDDFYDASSEFPCDLYYMDLNGNWTDPDGDGKFSAHTGSVQPEIWVSRVWTPTENGNNTQLINEFFNRNHQFRLGLSGCSRTGLSLIDDDWEGFNDCAMDSFLPSASIETITNPAQTTGDRYKTEINSTRGWTTIGVHSSPNGHSFKKPGGSDWVPNTYLRDTRPPKGFFYNLYACSNTRFTTDNYMGGWYIFDNPGGEQCRGLAAVGSTKTGSMLYFENFYTPMASGKVVGEAYKDWWIALGPDHNLDERRWFYGMSLLGDPTINWWHGATPVLIGPLNDTVFNHFPRNTRFTWAAVPVSGATYTIEIDAFGARHSGQWATQTGEHWLVQSGITGTSFNHNFVGAQRGRWRVKANVSGLQLPWSEWRYFRYTV